MLQMPIARSTQPPAEAVSARVRHALRPRRPADFRPEALGQTAPWLAGLSLACTLVVLWALAGRIGMAWLAGWGGLVVTMNIVALRARNRAAERRGEGFISAAHWVVAEAALHAALWSALPALAFPGQPPFVQMMLGGAIGTMIGGAFLLALVPLAATIWAVTLSGALFWAIHGAGGEALLGAAILLIGYCGVIVTGCLTFERLLSHHIAAARDERARRETVTALLHEYEEQSSGWLWQTDPANLLVYVSPRLATLLGRATNQLVGQSLPVMLGCDPQLGQALAAREGFADIQLRCRLASGDRWMALSGTPMIDEEGGFQGFRGFGVDVTDMRQSQERLTHMASIDVLTGLPNRQRMRELVAEAIGQAQGGGRPCAVLFLDLDGFKPVNDSFGHQVGDAVLRGVGQRLAAAVGPHGRVGRVGGDEFAVVLPDGQSRHVIEQMGQRLIEAVSAPFDFGSMEVRIGLSIGSAVAPIDGDSVDELLLKADLALYEAKSNGRGTIVHFDPRLQKAAEDRIRLEQDLRQALATCQLHLCYQPIICARSQQVLGFEALLRWTHPERGPISPAEFVPIAEESGLIADIGEWVIRQACRDAATWPDQLFVSVNLSPRQLVIPALPNVVSEALSAARIQPGRLELEVTESVFLSDSDGSLDVLRRVRAIGVGIALDDFGTGYSSLGYLNKTIFHTLKIDGSFVREAGVRAETISIIQAIVALANSFRMAVTAEGVETVDDFERMRALGCHKLQGYLFGRPVPLEETHRLLGQRWEYGTRKAG